MLRTYTGKVKPWVQYSIVRLVSFAIAFAVLMLVGVEWWLAAIIAAVIGLCISYIFFGKLRDAVALDFAGRRASPRPDTDADAEAEDAEVAASDEARS
jgi:divalent metal cation (Fe/Co/Zn/Cd) transporter